MVDRGESDGLGDVGVGDAMVRGRPEDTASTLLARARVAGTLFGPEAAVVGRFRILDRLGAGGMGVVYAAYDPELNRGVALKLVQVPAGGHDAALVEAKALARLSHPNVVPIYDVGVAGEHVYLVMELVRGETLGRWVRGRQRPEVIEVFQQAGAALAAAHRAGLVHRDFKPDNAIVGSDGRVRVVDFGLACEIDEAGGASGPARIAGTPRYMAPEQARGAVVTPAADQYSFCVALDEALADVADPPAPRWIAAITERGRAQDPAARFASMSELSKALARDPVRIRRRRVVAGGLAVGIAGVAFLVGQWKAAAPAAEVCGGAEAEIARAWSPIARMTALARLDGLGEYGRSVRAKIAAKLDDHAMRWIRGSRVACLDHRRGAQSDALFDRRTACLARGLAAWTEVGAIVGAASASTLAEVPRAVQALPDPAACADVPALVSGASPPVAVIAPGVQELARRLAGARVQLAAGRIADAREAATAVIAGARALGYRPLLAEALMIAGHATTRSDLRAAVPMLGEALELAISASADALAVEAWARRAFAQGTSTDPVAALDSRAVIAALATRAEVGAFPRALFHNSVGQVELARDQRTLARDAFARAIEHARGVTGAGALELVNARANLALVTDDARRTDALIQEAIAMLADRLGDEHPDTLDVRLLRAGMLEATAAAIATLEPACRGYELHRDLEARIALCWGELGFLALELEDRSRAVAALERATLRSRPGARPHDGAYLTFARGDLPLAAAQFRDALAVMERRTKGGWWDDLTIHELSLGLGRTQRALGALGDARRTLASSVAGLDEIVRNHPTAIYARKLARARSELARTLDALAPR